MTANAWRLAAEDYYGQLRYRGRLSVAQPMAFLLRVYDPDGGYGYSKVPKSTALEHELDCLFHGLPGHRLQVMLRLAHTVNTLVIWPPHVAFSVCEQGLFQEGVAFDLARFDDGRAAIQILGIACCKLRNLRCGLWRAKARYLDAITEDHKSILLKTRHGYIPARALAHEQ